MISTTKHTLRTATALVLAAGLAARLQATAPSFDIPAEDLRTAIQAFVAQSGARIIVASDLVTGLQSRTVVGAMSNKDVLARMLGGTGLHAELISGAYVLRRDHSPTAGRAAADTDILVTGTRIHGSAPIGAPLTVIDRQAIEDSGRATVADYIQTLPQNYAGGPNEGSYGFSVRNGAAQNQSYGSSINLRGLGTESTLVLFDGNRPALGGVTGAFADTSLIPSTAIERIEILTDGASAIYGTDAVAGVVNIRFRNQLDGFETQLYSGAAGGALHQYQVGQAAGKRWSNGGAMIAVQYDYRGRLPGADRSVSTEDLRPFGGPDYRIPYATPGNLIAADGSSYAIPVGQNGRGLTASQLLPGQTNVLDASKYQDILPLQKTLSVYASADQHLGAGFTAYVHALYGRRHFETVNPLSGYEPYSVPVTNPFYVDPIGTHEPVTVNYGFGPELGPDRQVGSVEAVMTSGGLKGRAGAWNLEASGSWGTQIEKSHEYNVPSYDRVEDALADTDPATALNLFGDGTGNNPATINGIRASFYDYSRYTVWSANLRVDGTLFDLPAGSVKLAAGAEHRDERFTGIDYSTTSSVDPLASPTPGTPGHRTIEAIYGELSIPILGPQTGHLPGRLDLSLAGRIDWYSDVGRTINPKAGLRWEPTSGVSLRGSYGTSFRAPGFTENVGASQNLYEPVALVDPKSPTGFTNVLAELGYAPTVGPEKATSWTIGIDVKPNAIPGLTITGTYFDIAYRDRIGSANPDYAMFLLEPDIYGGLTQLQPSPATVAALYASPNFINPFGIAASDIGAIINLETLNLSRVTTRGIDFTIDYSHGLAGGTASAGIAGTRFLAIDQRLTATSPVQNVLGTFYYPARLRFRAKAGWSKGGFDATAFVNYVDGYTNQLVIPNEHVKSWTTLDGQIGYRFDKATPLAGARLALSATNLLNRKPPYVDNHSFDATIAYDPGQASAVGRLVSVQATFTW